MVNSLKRFPQTAMIILFPNLEGDTFKINQNWGLLLAMQIFHMMNIGYMTGTLAWNKLFKQSPPVAPHLAPHWDMRHAFVKSAPLLSSMCFFGSTMCTDLCSNLCTGYFTLFCPQKGQKGSKKGQYWKVHDHGIFNGTGLNEIGTTHRTSRLSSLAHLLDL